MSDERGREHDLEAEYLYPCDVDVLDVVERDGELVVEFALPHPECGEAVELEAQVTEVTESDLDLPLDDEYYD
jgi:hypothetical protein